MAAPTLLGPYGSIPAGEPEWFQWTGSGQARFAIRIRVNGGAYQWWKGGSSWQSTVYPILSSSQSHQVQVPAVDGDVVQWSVAIGSGSLGPYSSERVVRVYDRPVFDVVAPVEGSVSASTSVTVEVDVPEGTSPSFWVYLWPHAVTTNTAWWPAINTAGWSAATAPDTFGLIAHAHVRGGSSHTFDRLPNNTELVAVVRGHANELAAPLIQRRFSVEALPPAAPTVTVAPDGPVVEVSVSTGANQATADQASFDTVVGWTADNATIEHTAQFGVAQLRTGAGKVIADGTGNPLVSPVDEWACEPGRTYSSTISIRDGGTVRSALIRRRWYDDSDTLISTSTGNTV